MSTVFLLLCVCASAQKKALKPDKISKLLPTKLQGYYAGDAKSTFIEIGTIRYSLAERSFKRGQKSIKILLFDYVEAPIMYTQAVRRWSQMAVVETDSIMFRPLSASDSSAWESHTVFDQHSQIILGVNNRFYLTVNAEKIPLEEVRKMLELFPFQKYPK